MKVAILRKKAAAEKVEIPNDVALFIAGTVQVEHPRARGPAEPRARLLLADRQARLRRARPGDPAGHPRAPRRTGPFPRRSSRLVASHYGLRVSDMKAKSNAKPIAFPRQVAMYLCRKLTDLSYPGDRPALQRQAPLDRHALGREDRAHGRGRPEFPQGRRGVSAALPLDAPRFAPVFRGALFHTRARRSRSRSRPLAAREERRVRRRLSFRAPFLLGFFRSFRLLHSPTKTTKCDRLFSLSGGGKLPWN